MPAEQRRIYLDANVLLAFVGNEPGRVEVVAALLTEAERGEIGLLTSVLSITEVAFGAQERDTDLTDEALREIDELWTPASPVTIVDMSQAIAREARAIIRHVTTSDAGRIAPADAIHLASAQIHGCDEVFTYEDEPTRRRWATVTGIAVSEPITDTPQFDI